MAKITMAWFCGILVAELPVEWPAETEEEVFINLPKCPMTLHHADTGERVLTAIVIAPNAAKCAKWLGEVAG